MTVNDDTRRLGSEGTDALERLDALVRTGVESRVLDPLWHRYVLPRLRTRVLTREQVCERCRTAGSLWTIERAEALPDDERGEYGPEFYRAREAYDCSPRPVCELSDATLLGDRGIVQTSDGELVYESFKNYPPYLRANLSAVPELLVRSAVRRRAAAFDSSSASSTRLGTAMSMVMHTIDPAQYGHWLLEYLPRLLALAAYEERTGREPDIVVRSDPPEWMVESLGLLGYPDDRLVEWEGGLGTVERLVQPFTSTSNESIAQNEFSPVEHRWLRNRLRDEVGVSDAGGERRYYVSRQGLDARYVANFEAVESVLDAYGFEVVRAEELGFREGVELFSRGGTFVGSHGSGLHNVLFATDATLVELFPPGIDKPSNRLLAGELGHEYVRLTGDRFAAGFSNTKTERLPYVIDPAELDATLDRVLS